MLPADAIGAPPPGPRAETVPGLADASPAAGRLAAALDRIAVALVRRAEADAAARDRDEHEPHLRPERGVDGTLDAGTVDELRHRVDAAILLVRATLGEA